MVIWPNIDVCDVVTWPNKGVNWCTTLPSCLLTPIGRLTLRTATAAPAAAAAPPPPSLMSVWTEVAAASEELWRARCVIVCECALVIRSGSTFAADTANTLPVRSAVS